MTIRIGNNTEFNLTQEATYGTTPASPRQYFDAVTESLVLDNPNIVSSRLRGGRLPTASALVKGGRKRVAGNLDLEVQAQSIGWFLKHLMGGYAVAGSMAPYTHTFTLGDLPVGLSIMVRRDLDVFNYKGCRVESAAFSVNDQMLKGNFAFIGQDATLGDTFGTTSYPANNDLFAFHEGTISVDNTSTPAVSTATAIDAREVDINFNNALVEMPKLGSRLSRQPIQGRAVITGTIRKDFEETTSYANFVAGSPASLKLSFIDTGTGAATLDFKFERIFYTGGTPNVANTGPIPHDLPFEVRDDGTTNGGISIVLANATATYV